MKTEFEEISTEYTDENGVIFIDGYKLNQDEGCVIGYVFNREVYYTNPDFKYDSLVISAIEDLRAENLIL